MKQENKSWLSNSTPKVMCIINATDDSFYDGSRTMNKEAITERVKRAIENGCDIFDVGGYSSRPMADDISPLDEWRRVDMAVGVIREISPSIPISIDTFRSFVVEECVAKYGKIIVNDISAGEADDKMWATVARLDLPYIAMHMRGTPSTMQSLTQYDNVVDDVVEYFKERIKLMQHAGIKEIILDPGFGFAKNVEQNFELLAGLSKLVDLGFPVLAGLSRKSMIYKTLGTTPAEALTGTIALNWESLNGGATILRVHDVRECAEIIKLHNKFKECKR